MVSRISDISQIKVDPDGLNTPVEAKVEDKKDSRATLSNKVIQDITDLNPQWSAHNSAALQSMNQYSLLAHKMSSLTRDFHHLLTAETEEDWVEISSPGETSSKEEIPFNEFDDVDLLSQTTDSSSVDDVLGRFLSKAKELRDSEGREGYLHGHQTKEYQQKLLERLQIKRLHADKILAEEKLARILNPKKDIVTFKAEIEIAQKKAMPEIKPDLAFVVSEKIAKNPKKDLAAQKVDEFEHQQYMAAFAGSAHKIEELRKNDPTYKRTRAEIRERIMNAFKGSVHQQSKLAQGKKVTF